MAQAGQPTTTNKEEEGTAVHSNGRDGRRAGSVVGSRWQIEEQVELIMNINECASCTTPARHRRYTGATLALHRRYTGATQALHWRDAGDVGRMEMNVE